METNVEKMKKRNLEDNITEYKDISDSIEILYNIESSEYFNKDKLEEDKVNIKKGLTNLLNNV